ncbi:hypothetical protein ACFY36_46635 [Actinoplanes sp. NPDC000266]
MGHDRLRRSAVASAAAVAGFAQVLAGLSSDVSPLQIVCLAVTTLGCGVAAALPLFPAAAQKKDRQSAMRSLLSAKCYQLEPAGLRALIA